MLVDIVYVALFLLMLLAGAGACLAVVGIYWALTGRDLFERLFDGFKIE